MLKSSFYLKKNVDVNDRAFLTVHDPNKNFIIQLQKAVKH